MPAGRDEREGNNEGQRRKAFGVREVFGAREGNEGDDKNRYQTGREGPPFPPSFVSRRRPNPNLNLQ